MPLPLEYFLGGTALIFMFMLSWVIAGFYQKCGPNEAMIISGFGAKEGERDFKIVKGGGAVVLPLLQQRQFLSLEVMTIDVRSQAPIITKNGVPIFVEGVAQVKVRGDDISISTAAEQFLGKNQEEIAGIAHETLVGHLRAILGTMTVEGLIQSFEEFAQRVQEVSIADLSKMGLTIVSFTIKEIKDNVGYLQVLGQQRIAEAKQYADIGVANAAKETTIKQATATEEGTKAQIAAQIRIAEQEKEREVTKAAYQAQINEKKAASDLVYQIVTAQSQQKLVEETQKIKIVEMEKEVELQAVQVKRREVELAAEITKPAEAEQTRVRLLALAEQEKRRILAQADADAARISAEGEAQAIKIKAQAQAEATRAMGLAEAEAIKARGLSDAAIIAAKGDAEAEAMSKKAEAFKQYNDVAMANMIVEKLPEVVSAAAQPLSRVGQMTVLSTGSDGSGASKITGDVLNVAAQGLTLVKGLTGVDLTERLREPGSNGGNKEKE